MRLTLKTISDFSANAVPAFVPAISRGRALRDVTKTFVALLHRDAIGMPDDLWTLGYWAWLSLRAADQKIFHKSALRQSLEERMTAFARAHAEWTRSTRNDMQHTPIPDAAWPVGSLPGVGRQL